MTRRRRLPDATLNRLVLGFERNDIRLAKAWQPKLERNFRKLAREAVGAYRDVMAAEVGKAHLPGEAPLEGQAAVAADEALTKRVMRALAKRLGGPPNSWRDVVLRRSIVTQYDTVFNATVNRVQTTLGMVINVPDPVAHRVIQTGGTRLGLVDVDKQTTDAIFRALHDGRSQNLGTRELERSIRSMVEGGPSKRVSTRAMRIARTETTYARNISTLASYESSGAFATVIIWDNRTGYDDPDCMARNGREVSFREAQTMIDAEHPNGTIALAPGSVNTDADRRARQPAD